MTYPEDFTDDLRRKPICGVLSVAIIAHVTFAQATNAIKNNLMPHQKRHGGRTYHEQHLKALEELGVQFIDYNGVPKVTLARWIKEECNPYKVYMVTTSSHVVTIRDGLVADQIHILPIEEHNSKRCYVRNVTEIL